MPLALKGSVLLQCIKYKTPQAFQGKLHCESTSVRQTAASRHICLVFATANVIVSKGNALIGGHVLTCSIQCMSVLHLRPGVIITYLFKIYVIPLVPISFKCPTCSMSRMNMVRIDKVYDLQMQGCWSHGPGGGSICGGQGFQDGIV